MTLRCVAAGAGLSIGGAVSGGIANAILFVDASLNLSQSANFTWGPTAGQGLTLAAGTATTDVAAFSLTRTNNNAAVATGFKIAFVDQLSAAGFLPLQILGGASGLTDLFSVNKSGGASAVTYNATSAVAAFTAASGGYIRTGNVYLNDVANQVDIYSNSGAFCIGATIDAFLNRPASGVLGAGTAVNNTTGSFRGKYQSSDATVGETFSGAVITLTVKDGIIVGHT